MKRFALATLTLFIALHASAFAASSPSKSSLLLAEAQAGIITMYIFETIDNPATLHTTRTQGFIDETFNFYRALAPNMDIAQMRTMRDALRGNTGPQDPSLQKKLITFEAHMLMTKPHDRQEAWMIGSRAMQIEYNALHFKNHTAARLFLTQIARMSVLDPILAPMHDLRLSLLSVKALHPQMDDWQREAIAGHAIAMLISQAGTKATLPIAGLIVGRPIAPAGPLSQHLLTHIEFIYADSRIKTMSSYTDGPLTEPKGLLHCGIDKVPYLPATFAIPLLLPVIGKDAATASFRNLALACENFDHTKPPLAYRPPTQTPDSVIPQLLLITDAVDGKFFLQFSQQWDQGPQSSSSSSQQ